MCIRDRNDRAEDVKITYIGGGSRGWAWNLMSDLAVEDQMSGTVTLYDIDIEAARNLSLIHIFFIRCTLHENVLSKNGYQIKNLSKV